jgi:hypothetical protein
MPVRKMSRGGHSLAEADCGYWGVGLGLEVGWEWRDFGLGVAGRAVGGSVLGELFRGNCWMLGFARRFGLDGME